LLILGAERGGHDVGRVDVLAVLERRVLGDDGRTSVGRALGIEIDAGRPVDGRVELLGNERDAAGAVDRIAEAVAIEVHENVVRLALHLEAVDENGLVDAVIIPLVERRELIGPSGDARLWVARDDRQRPLLIDRLVFGSSALRRVPGRRVGGAVIEEVELRVPGVPSPGRAASNLPLLAGPGL